LATNNSRLWLDGGRIRPPQQDTFMSKPEERNQNPPPRHRCAPGRVLHRGPTRFWPWHVPSPTRATVRCSSDRQQRPQPALNDPPIVHAALAQDAEAVDRARAAW